MTTPTLCYPISTMTLAPDAGLHPRPAREAMDASADVVNPFARRPRGEQLSRRERAGLLAVFAAVAAIIGFALVRVDRMPAPAGNGRFIVVPRPRPSPVSSRRPVPGYQGA